MAENKFNLISDTSSSTSSMQIQDESINVQNSFNSNEIILYVGQTFATLGEVEEFYRGYAKQNGFEIKIKTTRKHVGTNDVCSRLYQ